MNKKDIQKALKIIKENSPKRNFEQTIDLIINLKDLNLKNTDNHLNLFIPLHYGNGKKISVCGLVGPELMEASKEAFEETILVDDFDQYSKDPKKTKKLANNHSYFVAQATIMPKVAGAFGRILGTRGKMPNPKAGCVVPPGSNLKVLSEKLHKTAKVAVKTQPIIQVNVGKENMPEEEVIDNIISIFNNIIHHLPSEKNNIRNVLLKLTMGAPVLIGKEQKSISIEKPKEKPVEIKEEKEEKSPEEEAE